MKSVIQVNVFETLSALDFNESINSLKMSNNNYLLSLHRNYTIAVLHHGNISMAPLVSEFGENKMF